MDNSTDDSEPIVAESHQEEQKSAEEEEEEEVADPHRLLRLSELPADIEAPRDEDSEERREGQRTRVRELTCDPFCFRDDAILSIELKTVLDHEEKQVGD